MKHFVLVKDLKGAGKVYRAKPYVLPPNEPTRQRPLVAVEHIPVMHDQSGLRDFLALAHVLRTSPQGVLSLETATDGDGNVCIYNRLDAMCYQAKGLNSLSYGTEHMHMSITQDWRRVQLRASAWLWQYAEREYGLPIQFAKLGSGPGYVRVLRKGHASHRRVSQAAGYNDRSDPGSKYDWHYVAHAAEFYKKHGAFVIKRNGKLVQA